MGSYIRSKGLYVPNQRLLRAYCGGFSSGGGGSGGTISPAFFVSPTGNDSNNGTTSATPFLTLEKAQSAMQGQPSNGIKATTLMAGTYNRTATLTLTSSDANTTWQYDSNSGANTAILDGGNSFANAVLIGGNGITINGIKIQNYSVSGSFGIQMNANNGTVKNCDVSNTSSVSGATGAGSGAGIVSASNTSGNTIKNNYVHNQQMCAISTWAFGAGQTQINCTIANNVCIGCATALSDNGVIYTNSKSGSFTNVQITNNFIRDHGSSSLTNDVIGIYLDDNSAGVVVSGNIVGPPAVGAITTGNRNNAGAMLFNDDGVASHASNNTATNNIFDLGATAMVAIGGLWGSGNQITNNIVIANFAGALQTASSGNSGLTIWQDNANEVVNNNLFFNYGGGASLNQGQLVSDGNPTTSNPGFASGSFIYAFSGSPPALVSGSFQAIVGNWGPPGFSIPSSANHSNP